MSSAGRRWLGGLAVGLLLLVSRLPLHLATAGLPVSNDDANFVLRLEQIEIGAGAAFIGIAAWGIVDALVHYKPSIVRKPDESLLPPDMRPHTQPSGPPGGEKPRSTDEPKKPPGTTFNLLPTPLPGGAGFVLSWEF